MEYNIKKGKHYSDVIMPKFRVNQISGIVKFIGDFEYHIDKQKDTNKLIGLSDSYYHHVDSIRIGWRWSEVANKLEIMTILYRDSKRSIEHLCYVEDMNKEYDFEIKILSDYYLVIFNKTCVFIDRTSNWCFPRFVLKPYFGGTTKSPKNFKFDIVLR